MLTTHPKTIIHLLKQAGIIDHWSTQNINLWTFVEMLTSQGLPLDWRPFEVSLENAHDHDILTCIEAKHPFITQEGLIVIQSNKHYNLGSTSLRSFLSSLALSTAFFDAVNDYLFIHLPTKQAFLINHDSYCTSIDLLEKERLIHQLMQGLIKNKQH
jgi:hypothetical protein